MILASLAAITRAEVHKKLALAALQAFEPLLAKAHNAGWFAYEKHVANPDDPALETSEHAYARQILSEILSPSNPTGSGR